MNNKTSQCIIHEAQKYIVSFKQGTSFEYLTYNLQSKHATQQNMYYLGE